MRGAYILLRPVTREFSVLKNPLNSKLQFKLNTHCIVHTVAFSSFHDARLYTFVWTKKRLFLFQKISQDDTPNPHMGGCDPLWEWPPLDPLMQAPWMLGTLHMNILQARSLLCWSKQIVYRCTVVIYSLHVMHCLCLSVHLSVELLGRLWRTFWRVMFWDWFRSSFSPVYNVSLLYSTLQQCEFAHLQLFIHILKSKHTLHRV